MLPEKRRQEIQRLNKEHQGISIKDLAKYFNISNMTVLRDIKQLEKRGLLEVVRGGVIPIKSDIQDNNDQPFDVYDNKKNKSLNEKQQIAAYCSSFVKEGNIIVLEAGSTAGAMVSFLTAKRKITMISNGLVVVKEATDKLDATSRVICAGGLLDRTYSTFVGPDVDRFFENKQTDIAFVSCAAFDLNLGAMDSNPLDIQAKRSILNSAQRRVLMVDKNKFNIRSVMQTVDMAFITDLVTNANVPEEVLDALQKFKELGVRIHLA